MEPGEGLDHVEAMHVDNGGVDGELGPTGFSVKQIQPSQCNESAFAYPLMTVTFESEIICFFPLFFIF